MILFSIVSAGILGLIVGSFLNVVILRMNTGMGLGGRSRCFRCNRTLSWYELIPVISFLIQKGKCTNCKTNINIQYPLVELITAILFVLPIIAFGITGLHSLIPIGIAWLVASFAVVISAYDIRHMMIPWQGLVACLVLGLGLMVIPSLHDIAIGAPFSVPLGMRIIGAIVLPLPFFLIWLFSRGRMFGIGDVELMVPIGMTLGIVLGGYALLFAFWSATLLIGFCMVVFPKLFSHQRKSIMKQAIPFGPFLLAGWYIMLVFGHHITGLIAQLL